MSGNRGYIIPLSRIVRLLPAWSACLLQDGWSAVKKMMKQTVRMTHQREIILDELKRTRTHPTADELYTRVKKRLPRISLATVYRNLETLSSAGLVAKLEITGRQKRFDWNQQPHDHITCTECHRIDDILPPPGTGRHCDMPVNQHGYNLTGWRVEYFGICPSCQYKQNKEKKALRRFKWI